MPDITATPLPTPKTLVDRTNLPAYLVPIADALEQSTVQEAQLKRAYATLLDAQNGERANWRGKRDTLAGHQAMFRRDLAGYLLEEAPDAR